MTAIDSSVCIPALAAWHVAHERCRPVAAGATIPAHALLETYSVLTRLPAPHRLKREVVAELLDSWFARTAVLPVPPVCNAPSSASSPPPASAAAPPTTG